jgi:putative endonuclease
VTRARLALGAAGEDLAAAWYEARGYQVLARNWRCREGELDLILRRAPPSCSAK